MPKTALPNHTHCDSLHPENKTYCELRRQPPFISTHLNIFCVHINKLQNLQWSPPPPEKKVCIYPDSYSCLFWSRHVSLE